MSGEEHKCACKSHDARQCFLIRHPECRRKDDSDTSMYDTAIYEECECSCHEPDIDEYYDSLDEWVRL